MRRRSAFTLIELLVVIAIMGVLIGMLLPAIQKVREASYRTQCQNNLKQLAVALHAYEATERYFPPSYTVTLTGTTITSSYSWGVLVLPYLEQQGLYQGYHFDELLNSANNQPVIATHLKVVQCPSTPRLNRLYSFTLPKGALNASPAIPAAPVTWQASASDYIPPSGVLKGLNFPASGDRAGMLSVNRPMRSTQIMDGLSNTIMVAELAGRPDVYRVGTPSTLNVAAGESTAGAGWGDPLNGEQWFNGSLYDGTGTQGPCPINCTNISGRGLYAFHPGGANVAMGDGSVRFLDASIDPPTFAYLVTRSGGEVINGSAY